MKKIDRFYANRNYTPDRVAKKVVKAVSIRDPSPTPSPHDVWGEGIKYQA
jgi:hypothetical protein